MGKREAVDRTAHISIIAGLINPTNISFAKSEDASLPNSLIFTKGYTITNGCQLGSAYLDVEVPLERVIYDSEHGQSIQGDAVTVRLRAYWKPLYRFRPEIPLRMTAKYYTLDGVFAGVHYVLRTIKRPVHYTLIDDEDRAWGFRWGRYSGLHPTHIVREFRGGLDPDNTLCLAGIRDFKSVDDLTAEAQFVTDGDDGYTYQSHRVNDVLRPGVFEGLEAILGSSERSDFCQLLDRHLGIDTA